MFLLKLVAKACFNTASPVAGRFDRSLRLHGSEYLASTLSFIPYVLQATEWGLSDIEYSSRLLQFTTAHYPSSLI